MKKYFTIIILALVGLLLCAAPALAQGVTCRFDAELYQLSSNTLVLRSADHQLHSLNAAACRVVDDDMLEKGCTVRVTCTAHAGEITVSELRVILPSYARRKAAEILAAMTLREKVGQMLFVRCPSDNSTALIEQVQPGGVILFDANTANKTPDTLRAYIGSMQACSEIPLLVGVDEEGGTVCRISCHPQYRSTRFASPQNIYKTGGMEQILATETEKAQLLSSLGFNVNFAPVADVSTDSSDFINARSLGVNAAVTADYIAAVVPVMQQNGTAAVLKHFPGYGNNTDTHTGVATDTRSAASIRQNDLLPFSAGIEAGAALVLVSHNLVCAFDDVYPASLSPAVHSLLRDELGFDGLIITDDLAMGGVTDLYTPDETAVLAVKAGNDLLLTSAAERQLNAIISAVEKGELDESLIDQAVLRILYYKIGQGWL